MEGCVAENEVPTRAPCRSLHLSCLGSTRVAALAGLYQGCGVSHQSAFWRHLREEGCIANCRSLHALVLLSAAEMSGNCRTRALVRGIPAADGKELFPLAPVGHGAPLEGCPGCVPVLLFLLQISR